MMNKNNEDGTVLKSAFLFDIFQRHRRWVFKITNTANKFYYCPFYDYDVFLHALNIPDDKWKNRVAYSKAFSEKFPKLAGIIEQKTRMPVNASSSAKRLGELKLKTLLLLDKVFKITGPLKNWRPY